MKLISWNIDSLNAALTSDSNRAHMSRDVIQTIISYDADVIAIQETKLPQTGPSKKHLQLLEEYFPHYELAWRSSVEPARKGYARTMFLYKKDRKSTRLNSSHVSISYAVFCLKKKNYYDNTLK